MCFLVAGAAGIADALIAARFPILGSPGVGAWLEPTAESSPRLSVCASIFQGIADALISARFPRLWVHPGSGLGLNQPPNPHRASLCVLPCFRRTDTVLVFVLRVHPISCKGQEVASSYSLTPLRASLCVRFYFRCCRDCRCPCCSRCNSTSGCNSVDVTDLVTSKTSG